MIESIENNDIQSIKWTYIKFENKINLKKKVKLRIKNK